MKHDAIVSQGSVSFPFPSPSLFTSSYLPPHPHISQATNIIFYRIPIHERVELPESWIPADSRVEIDAKITAGMSCLTSLSYTFVSVPFCLLLFAEMASMGDCWGGNFFFRQFGTCTQEMGMGMGMRMEHPHFLPAEPATYPPETMSLNPWSQWSQASMARGDLIGLKWPFTAYVECRPVQYTIQCR